MWCRHSDIVVSLSTCVVKSLPIVAHMELGRRLRQLRIRAGFTQRSLADLLEVHYTAVSHVEQDKRSPSLDLLEKWATACGAAVAIATPVESQLLAALLVDGVDPDLLIRLARLLPGLSGDNQDTLKTLLKSWEKATPTANTSQSGLVVQKIIS